MQVGWDTTRQELWNGDKESPVPALMSDPESVPAIATRGAGLLSPPEGSLAQYEEVVIEQTHKCRSPNCFQRSAYSRSPNADHHCEIPPASELFSEIQQGDTYLACKLQSSKAQDKDT